MTPSIIDIIKEYKLTKQEKIQKISEIFKSGNWDKNEDSYGHTIWGYAVFIDRHPFELLSFLLENGFNIDDKPHKHQKDTALHEVLSANREIEIIKFLTDRASSGFAVVDTTGVKFQEYLNQKSDNGYTPLMLTTNYKAIKYLVDSGMDINATDNNNRGILHIQNCTEKILRYYIRKGININQQDAYGYTPLMCALSAEYNPHINFVNAKILLEAGADVTLRDILKKNVLEREFKSRKYTFDDESMISVNLLLEFGNFPINELKKAIDFVSNRNKSELYIPTNRIKEVQDVLETAIQNKRLADLEKTTNMTENISFSI